MSPRRPSAGAPGRLPAIRVIMMPRDTNALGTIFGGRILSLIDQAGAVEAQMHGTRFVTVALREVEFHQPVFVGDLVSFYASVTRLGRTSITVRVTVEADRRLRGGATVLVTEAEVVYVHIDDAGRPIHVGAGAGPAAQPRGE